MHRLYTNAALGCSVPNVADDQYGACTSSSMQRAPGICYPMLAWVADQHLHETDLQALCILSKAPARTPNNPTPRSAA